MKQPSFKEKQIISAAAIGNALEYYDFALYGLLSPILSVLFFPQYDTSSSILMTLGVYAIGFVSRPLGSIIFGYYGDKYGRKNALSLSILLMAFSCLIIGALPTYNQIGFYSTIFLIMARFLQGVCMGGEYSGAIVFSLEHSATQTTRNFSGGLLAASTLLGCLLASLVTAFFSYFESTESLWRVSFLIGTLIGLWGLYLRQRTPETPAFLKEKKDRAQSQFSPFPLLWRNYKRGILCAIILFSLAGINSGFSTTFLSMFCTKELSFKLYESLLIVSFGLVFYIVGALLASNLLRLFSIRSLLLYVSFCLGVLSLLIIKILILNNVIVILVGLLVFSFLSGIFWGVINPFIYSLFPTTVRYSGVAISDSIARALFAGTAPMFMFFLKDYFYTPFAVGVYLLLVCVIAFLCCFLISHSDEFKMDKNQRAK
ncbi:MAG: MFS transporter [Alphaproteobacteria bacterium]|nr:MFS transporter [Alphaproteobacteria bacterium]